MDNQKTTAALFAEKLKAAKNKDEVILICTNTISFATSLESELEAATITITELGALTGNDGQVDIAKLVSELTRIKSQYALSQEQLTEAKNQYILLQSQFNEGQEIIDDLRESLSDLQEQYDESISEVGKLSRRLELQSELSEDSGKLLVDVVGVPHLLHGNRFSFKGESELNAQQLSKRPDLLSLMKARESGALVPVEK